MPSAARSMAKPLIVPSLPSFMLQPLFIEHREAGGHQASRYEPLFIFAVDLPSWSSTARYEYEYRLPKVIVGSEVRVPLPQS